MMCTDSHLFMAGNSVRQYERMLIGFNRQLYLYMRNKGYGNITLRFLSAPCDQCHCQVGRWIIMHRCADWCSIGWQIMSDRQRITEQQEFMPTAYTAGLIQKKTVSAECLMLGRFHCYCVTQQLWRKKSPFYKNHHTNYVKGLIYEGPSISATADQHQHTSLSGMSFLSALFNSFGAVIH